MVRRSELTVSAFPGAYRGQIAPKGEILPWTPAIRIFTKCIRLVPMTAFTQSSLASSPWTGISAPQDTSQGEFACLAGLLVQYVYRRGLREVWTSPGELADG